MKANKGHYILFHKTLICALTVSRAPSAEINLDDSAMKPTQSAVAMPMISPTRLKPIAFGTRVKPDGKIWERYGHRSWHDYSA